MNAANVLRSEALSYLASWVKLEEACTKSLGTDRQHAYDTL